MSCPHNRKVGDNYGLTCMDCGAILEGYGNNAETRPKECIHKWMDHGMEKEYEVCIYCERVRKKEQ